MTTMTDSEALAVLETLVDNFDYGGSLTKAEAGQARAHIAEALRDSRRYRGLVASGAYSPGVRGGSCPWGLRMSGSNCNKAELDTAIDAAMKDEE